jgi:hypothetical protein
LKENVACGYRKRAFAMAGTERCSKNQCVEVAAVIRNEYKWPVRRQVFSAGYRESVRDREITSQQRKTNVMREAFEQTAFTSYTSEALCWR